jgi:fatty acid-binding protein DegV
MKVVISLFKDGLVYYSKTLKASNIPEIVDQMFEEKLQYKNKKIKRIGLISSEINEEKYNIESLKEAMLKYFNVRKCDKGVVPAAIMAHTGPNYLGFCIEVEE